MTSISAALSNFSPAPILVAPTPPTSGAASFDVPSSSNPDVVSAAPVSPTEQAPVAATNADDNTLATYTALASTSASIIRGTSLDTSA